MRTVDSSNWARKCNTWLSTIFEILIIIFRLEIKKTFNYATEMLLCLLENIFSKEFMKNSNIYLILSGFFKISDRKIGDRKLENHT